MTDIKLMVDAARQLNQTWNECSKNAEEESTPEVYNAMCEVDEAVINLVEKISLCLKEKAIVEMYGVSELSKTHKSIIERNKV